MRKIILIILLCSLVLISGCIIFKETPYCEKDFLDQYAEALKTGDTSVCESFGERGYSDFKGFAKCLLKNNESFTRDDCFTGIAKSTQDIKVCSDFALDNCFAQIKELPNNPLLCNEVDSNNYQERIDRCYELYQDRDTFDCEALQTGRVQSIDDCYAYVANINLNASQCESVYNIITKTFCVRDIALSTEDISICDIQSNPRIKFHCYGGLADIGFYDKLKPSQITQEARDKITVELCKQIDETDPLQDFCFMHAIIYHNDDTLCGREDIPQKRRVIEGCNYIGAFS